MGFWDAAAKAPGLIITYRKDPEPRPININIYVDKLLVSDVPNLAKQLQALLEDKNPERDITLKLLRGKDIKELMFRK